MVSNPTNPQSLNRYSYTHNNPLKYTDPTGHQPNADGPGPVPWPIPWDQLIQAIQQLSVEYAPAAAAVGVGIVAGVAAFGASLGIDWAIQDNGPDYPMPAQPGKLQVTYPLPGTNTLMTGAVAIDASIVFAKPARKAVVSLADHLSFLLGETTGGFPDPDNRHDPKKPRNDRNSLEHIRNALKDIWKGIQKSNIRGGIEEFLVRHYSDVQRLGLLKALQELQGKIGNWAEDNPDYIKDILESLKKLGVPPK